MGSLKGHILPGSIFALIALWTLYCVLRDYYRSKYVSGFQYKNYASHSILISRTKIPAEALFKLVLTVFGTIGEVVYGYDADSHSVYSGSVQHMTMYLCFGFSGFVDLLIFYNILNLPTGFQYLTLIMAFFSEGFLFYNHVHGRSPMDIQLHMFLLVAIGLCVFCVLAELRHQYSHLAGISRGYFLLLQGTWFYHTGFVLYPPTNFSKWDEENHHQMMFITLDFIWHLMADLIVVILISILMARRMRKAKNVGIKMADVEYQPISNDDNDIKTNT
ncbi:hypothetical protein CHUAL_012129 [Chamberlinius hualienensis]